MEFPTETLAAIVALLTSKRDLKAVRLVNKAFAAVAVAQLFETIHISPVARDVNDARSIYENFGPYIRNIRISGATRSLNPFDTQKPGVDVRTVVVQEFHEDPDAFDILSSQHLSHVAAVHSIVCEERKATLTPQGLERLLRQVLRHAPRVESLHFTLFPRDRDIYHEELHRWCPDPKCYEVQGRVYYFSIYDRYSKPDLADIKARIQSAIQVMARARPGIKYLEFDGYPQSLRIPRGVKGTFGTLPNLSTLQMTIDVECDGKNRVSAWLAASTQLEKLYIEIHSQPRYNDRSTTTLNEVLATCRFPKLKLLILAEFDSDSQELLRFLQRCGPLEQVVLLGYNLHDNTVESWHRVLNDIRNTTRLEPIKNIEDLALSSHDTSRKKPDEWVMEPWEDTKTDQLRFLSDTLDHFHTMFRIYLWGGHECAKGGNLDEHLFCSHRRYKGSIYN